MTIDLLPRAKKSKVNLASPSHGNFNDTDACLTSCTNASCGDSFIWAGVEICDDGNADNTDACLNTCEMASCGDAVTWAGVEVCDDGNLDDTDGCRNDCTLP